MNQDEGIVTLRSNNSIRIFNTVISVLIAGFFIYFATEQRSRDIIYPLTAAAISIFFVWTFLARISGVQALSIEHGLILMDEQEIGQAKNISVSKKDFSVLIHDTWHKITGKFKGDRDLFIDQVNESLLQRYPDKPHSAMPNYLPKSLHIKLDDSWQALRNMDTLEYLCWAGPCTDKIKRFGRVPTRLSICLFLMGVLVCIIASAAGGILILIAFLIFLFNFIGTNRTEKQSIIIHSHGLILVSKTISGEMTWDDLNAIVPVTQSMNGWKTDTSGKPQGLKIETRDDAEILIHDQFDVPLAVIRKWILTCSRS